MAVRAPTGYNEGMLALGHMSYGAQALFFGIALVAFIVAAVFAWVAKAVWAMFVGIGLACFAFVMFWNALALA